MKRNRIYRVDDALIVGPGPDWVRVRFRALYGRDPVNKIECIKLEYPRFLAGPKPEKPDLRWTPEGFRQTIPI